MKQAQETALVLGRFVFLEKDFPPNVSSSLSKATMIGLIVLVLLCGEVSAGSHTLRYFLTGVTPIPGIPEFVAVGYVDGVQFVMYDSDGNALIPREQWMVESEGREAWERKTMLAQEQEQHIKKYLPILMARTNQSGGIHTHQMLIGCDLNDDGTRRGIHQRGWDGGDFISFDPQHMVWVTPVPWGENFKTTWDQFKFDKQRWKHYLEVECIEWLRKYLEYGQRELRVVAPVVSFTRLGDSNRLSCVVTGFYPQAIEVTLWRDGVLIEETLSTGILPNHDRTYQIRKWMEFDPEDQAEYSCRVEHSGLEEEKVVIYEPKSQSQVPVPVGIILGIIGIIALTVVAVVVYKRKVSSQVLTINPGISVPEISGRSG
ncbi:class I histocompatibility antigen, F10 alpha chain-like [Carcharodon carcharias]|uniref:class I histocompatibility antigen, F10 alpha chain-like n=1 Tax=Carcharodon carcharias TaxID=13397 RepID=UPI001B7F15DE|nr:class I histocompatibility antigen, F10 alpha chain-like [Carcharodon carcharias]